FQENVPKFITSVCFYPAGEFMIGDSTGAILVWSHDNKLFSLNATLCSHTQKAHK
ncbi:unnamed protein product, partial [Lymnaea stagnalis]